MSTNTNQEIDPAFADPSFTAAPTKPKAKGKTLDKRATDWQENADQVVEAALSGVPNIVCGRELHHFSTARGSLLRRIKSEFVGGVQLDDISDPFLAVGRFLIIMSTELSEARKLVAYEDKLDDAAYALMDTLPLRDMGDTVAEINAFVHREMSNQVHGEIPESNGPVDSSAPKN